MISEMSAQYVANFWGRTVETARSFFQQLAEVTKRIRKNRSTHAAALHMNVDRRVNRNGLTENWWL